MAAPRLAGTEECRQLAETGSIDEDGLQGSLACQFDVEDLRYACRTDVGDVVTSTTSDFASVADFVEAARHIGKVTSLGEVRAQGDRVTRVHHFYDEIGRLTRSVEERPEGDVIHIFGNYDAAGRPRLEQQSGVALGGSDCTRVAVTLEYADAAGTVSRSFEPAAGCAYPVLAEIDYYDAAGNRVRVETDRGNGLEPELEALPGNVRAVCG